MNFYIKRSNTMKSDARYTETEIINMFRECDTINYETKSAILGFIGGQIQ